MVTLPPIGRGAKKANRRTILHRMQLKDPTKCKGRLRCGHKGCAAATQGEEEEKGAEGGVLDFVI